MVGHLLAQIPLQVPLQNTVRDVDLAVDVPPIERGIAVIQYLRREVCPVQFPRLTLPVLDRVQHGAIECLLVATESEARA